MRVIQKMTKSTFGRIMAFAAAFVMTLTMINVQGITTVMAAELESKAAGETVVSVGNATLVASQELNITPYEAGKEVAVNGVTYSSSLKSTGANNAKVGGSTARCFGYLTATKDTNVDLVMHVGKASNIYVSSTDLQIPGTNLDTKDRHDFAADTVAAPLEAGSYVVHLKVEAGKYYYLVGVGSNLELLDIAEGEAIPDGGNGSGGETPDEPTVPSTQSGVKTATAGKIDSYFTLNGKAEDDATNGAKSYTIDGKVEKSVGRIKLGGTGVNNSISFTVADGKTAKVEVWAISGTADTASEIALYNASGEPLKTEVAYNTLAAETGYVDKDTEYGKAKNPIALTLTSENLASGEYKIATPAEHPSVNVYYIRVTETGSSENPGGETPETPGEEKPGGEPSENQEIREFVSRLYTVVLDREPDEAGLESWTKVLVEGTSDGVDASYGFIFSNEFMTRGLTNEQIVEVLYQTFMNRAGDEAGSAAWAGQLNNGVTLEKVYAGFVYSAEYAGICERTGIRVGSVDNIGPLAETIGRYRNQKENVTAFVARCYTQALGRAYDVDGLENWCKAIITQANTPKGVATEGFFFSNEFRGKTLTDEEYVQILYRTFLGREADPSGLAGWKAVLEKGEEGRDDIINGFADSAEFAGILESFGLK